MQNTQLLFKDLEQADIDRWLAQNIVLHASTPYLIQHQGGPCGVLACLQGFVLAYAEVEHHKPPVEALESAIEEILLRAGEGRCVIVGVNKQPTALASPVQQALQAIRAAQFDRESGVVRFVLSVVLSRGEAQVRADMDDHEGSLAGRFGHCGQEMLNLLLTGRASSQMHDGTLRLAEGLTLRGVQSRPRVGFLSHLEALRLSKVGAYMKNPVLPIWVLGSESHFTVLFSRDLNCDLKGPGQQALESAHRAFGQRDGNDNGFVEQEAILPVLTELGLANNRALLDELVAQCLESGGVLLFSDFWAKLERASSSSAAWACPRCTLSNAAANARCEVCDLERPSKPQDLWTCIVCTCASAGPACAACGSPRPRSDSGGKRIDLVHVNGLIGRGATAPLVTRVVLTTVDAAIPQQLEGGSPFEETVRTKWPGAIVDLVDGVQPNIKG